MEKIMNFTFYKLLFEQSLDAILITNPTGEIIDANPAACDILKMTEKEIIIGGRNAVVDLNDPRLEAGLIERKNKGYIRTELNLKRKNGEIFPVSLTSKIFKDENGIERTVIIFRDITIYKNAEKVVLQNTQDHKKMPRLIF